MICNLQLHPFEAGYLFALLSAKRDCGALAPMEESLLERLRCIGEACYRHERDKGGGEE